MVRLPPLAGRVRHVGQRVVHPAQVPLEVEPEPADARRTGDVGPGGRFLGDRQDVGELEMDLVVEPAEEGDRLVVRLRLGRDAGRLAPVARGLEVEHRGDRVDPDGVDVIEVEPVERVGDQEVRHFGAAEVEDVRAPVAVLPPVRVGMLVQGRAVEAAQPVRVAGEVRGDPVEDHAQAAAMQRIDQRHEVVRRAEAALGAK